MPKRRKPAVILAILLGTALTGYLLWTRVSAMVVLGWFIEETGIPVELRSASWDVSLKRLLGGKIDGLSVEVYYKPLKLVASIETPVEYVHKGSHWTIRLQPRLSVGDFPQAVGRIDLELDKKIGTLVNFNLREANPLALKTDDAALSAQSWSLNGKLRWNPLEPAGKSWTASTKFVAEKVAAKLASGAVVSAARVSVDSDLSWPSTPPLPLKISSAIKLEAPQALSDAFLATEAELALKTAFQFDGQAFEQVDISVDKPARVRLKGRYDTKTASGDAKFSLRADLRELIDERLSSWLENTAPALRRAKAQGTLALNGSATLLNGAPRADAELKLEAERFALPTRNLKIENLKIDAPLAYPHDPLWGEVRVDTVDFQSVKLKRLAIDVLLTKSAVSVTTEGDEGKDRPIRQSVWGGTIEIGSLYARVPLFSDEKPEFTASVTGGPFALPLVQSDLCVLPGKPLNGSLSFTYPKILLDKNSFRLIGDTNLAVFNGTAHIGDMNLVLTGDNPKLNFSLDWTDLDLQAIGAFTNFGDMRGTLEGALLDTTMALTKIGPIPLSYDLTVRGRERGGKKIRFYGRAMDNILTMMGSPQDQMGVAGMLLNIATTWRNWMPATAEYMGFRAKSNGDWTELTTFDPPESKKHYLLLGTAFTIPLNSHGVYPVLMRTASFHSWLAGMIEYFKGRVKDESKQHVDEPSCTPLW